MGTIMWQVDSIIAIVIGVINLLALAFVGWQIWLTRKSLSLTQASNQEYQRTREILQLPNVGWLIHVTSHLTIWRNGLQKIIDDEQSIRSRVEAGDKKVGDEYGLRIPKGIIRKDIYDMLPAWLQHVLMAAAKYYFDGKSFAYGLSETESNRALRMLPETIDRCKTGIRRIDEMKSYIEYIVPEWYLNSPASEDDDKFF